jgi:hypothetical protein
MAFNGALVKDFDHRCHGSFGVRPKRRYSRKFRVGLWNMEVVVAFRVSNFDTVVTGEPS